MITMMLTMMMVMMMMMVMASLTGHIYLATLPIEAQLWPASANWYTLFLEATFAFRWILSMSLNVQIRGSKHQICLWNQILFQGWLDLCSALRNYFRDSISSDSIQICCQIKIWPTGPLRRSVNTNHKSLPSKGFDQTASVISSDTLLRSESQFSDFPTPDFLLISLH